jgi:nitroimidazol reductase NimA-like FMN-containing flavoprotein (pyridoxamine 5'-phosphate oxidase superfamily)
MIVLDRNYDGGLGVAEPASGSQKVSRAEAMRLLASVDYGRVVFTLDALPAIRPVNHLVDEGRVIIRTRLTRAISTAVTSADSGGVVVAYEADDFDPRSRSGWSVVVTGWARRVADPEQVSRYEQLLDPWVNHADTVLSIEPEVVSGLLIKPSSETGKGL